MGKRSSGFCGQIQGSHKTGYVSIRDLRDTAMPTNKITLAERDRRKRLRFPLDTEVRFQMTVRGRRAPTQGTGTVENISSRGLAFRADAPFEPGERLSVSMAWPAKLDECMLRLAFEGVVLRAEGGLVVVSIERPEFRTAGKSTAAAREEMAAVASRIESLVGSASIRV